MDKNKGVELKQKDYTIQIKYSKEAEDKKLMKFISKSGDEFEISADEMLSFLVEQVNMDTLSPAFVETTKVNVVEVSRQLQCVLDKDLKKGEVININYIHPYPIEFALIEEGYKIAKINLDVPAVVLTREYIEDVKTKIKPEMQEYVKNFYKSFKKVNIK